MLRVLKDGRELLAKTLSGDGIDLNLDLRQGTHSVVVICDGHRDAGYLFQGDEPPRELSLMLIHKDEEFTFAPDLWTTLRGKRPSYSALPEHVTGDRTALACLLNLLEAIQWLPNGAEVVDALQEITEVRRDRAFFRARKSLIEALQDSKVFEKAPYKHHPGADMGFKEYGRFGEANLNFSVQTRPDDVVAEVDLDYYDDKLAHVALEVLPNKLTGGHTNPARTYAMRWMAIRNYQGKLADAVDPHEPREFDPLFTVGPG